MQLLGSNSISIPFFSPRVSDAWHTDRDCCCGFHPNMSPSSSAFCFFVYHFCCFFLIFHDQIFQDSFFATCHSSNHSSSSLGRWEYCLRCPRALLHIKPYPNRVTSMAENLLVALMKRQRGWKTLMSFRCPCWTTCQAADEQHQHWKVIEF